MANGTSWGTKRGLRRANLSFGPIPTQIVSNEEFVPLPQTPDQAHVELTVSELSLQAATRLGVSRRDFLRTSGGMAAALLALNSVFGRFFGGVRCELFRPLGFCRTQGLPLFHFRLQTQLRGSQYDPTDAE